MPDPVRRWRHFLDVSEPVSRKADLTSYFARHLFSQHIVFSRIDELCSRVMLPEISAEVVTRLEEWYEILASVIPPWLPEIDAEAAFVSGPTGIDVNVDRLTPKARAGLVIVRLSQLEVQHPDRQEVATFLRLYRMRHERFISPADEALISGLHVPIQAKALLRSWVSGESSIHGRREPLALPRTEEQSPRGSAQSLTAGDGGGASGRETWAGA